MVEENILEMSKAIYLDIFLREMKWQNAAFKKFIIKTWSSASNQHFVIGNSPNF